MRRPLHGTSTASHFPLLLFLTVAICGPLVPTALAATGPNIVVVLIDDMGWGDFSCYGNTLAKTPNIDRIASQGIRFEQFYVNAPICSPSRCALVTGQYPQRWNIHSYLSNRAENQSRGCADWLDPRAPTLPRLLQQNGYATGHFGKWHLGGQRNVDDAPEITSYGFDASLTNFEGMGPKLLPLTIKPGDTQPGRIWQDAQRLGGPVTWMQRSEITEGFIKAAIAFAEQARAKNQPFYINLWPDDVHSPFWPPVDRWPENQEKPTKRAMYHAVLENMDRQLQFLFDYLDSDPVVRDNTLLFLCSDNGPEAQAGSAGPFRNGKTSLYEGGVRSPLIVWGPGLIGSGIQGRVDTESFFAQIDLVPSILDLCGVDPGPLKSDGQSVSRALLGQDAIARADPLFWRRPPDRKTYSPESRELLPDLAVRHGRWKLLCNYDGSEPQLYDLQLDRAEQRNLVADPSKTTDDVAQRFEKLRSQVLEWHRTMPEDNGVELGKPAIKRVAEGTDVKP